MARHRSHSVAFKRQVAQEYLSGETLHGLAKRHDLSRNLVRVWVQKYETGAFDDLPWQDRSVTWQVQVRRFRCDHCPGRIFAERVPGLGARKARRSDRLAEAQTDIGMVLGGEPGARLSLRLAMPVSGDTVLRLIRRRGTVPSAPPRVVGIDDSAWRRGRSYGTIVCDLERRRVIDLLPGRSSAPVRDWLAAHPSVTVISRDRSGPYAEAARTGAPTATQVADRWHLLVNASEALRGIVERHQSEIRDVTRWLTGDPAAPAQEDRAFADLLRQSDPTGLTPWLEAAAVTDLGGFVTGLRQDENAVRAAIVEPWSNSPVEVQVNRLKLIKRSMYGRAGFDLLRQRVLHAA